MSQTVEKVYLHWSATPYNWNGLEANGKPAYHTVRNDLGHRIRHVDYKTALDAHTFRRNLNAVALACACMGGRGFADYPPTHAAIDDMCKEAAEISIDAGWSVAELPKRVLTHAEAAANRDYPRDLAFKAPCTDNDGAAEALGLPHDNYGPSHWRGAPVDSDWPGGTVDRWDWWYCHIDDEPHAGNGGYVLRNRIAFWMGQLAK